MPVHFVVPPPSTAEPSPALARRVHLRDGRACVYCGASSVPLVVEHVRPKAHFPASAPASTVDAPRNLVAACDDCNGAKGPQNLAGFAAMLRGRGIPPTAVASMKRRVRAAARRRLPLSVVP